MSSLIIRPSKFGKALVIKTHKNAGGYILGFRLDPPELLEKVSTYKDQPKKFNLCFILDLFVVQDLLYFVDSKSFKI